MGKIFGKIFENKRNKQWTITLPKKQLKAVCPTIKSTDLIELKPLKKKRGKK